MQLLAMGNDYKKQILFLWLHFWHFSTAGSVLLNYKFDIEDTAYSYKNWLLT